MSRQSGFLGGLSTSYIRNILPRSISSSKQKSNPKTIPQKYDAENIPPLDANVQHEVEGLVKQSVSKLANSDPELTVSDTRVPDVKTEAVGSDGQNEVSVPGDSSSVKVVVRIAPINEHRREEHMTVKKLSSDSVCVGDRKFTFDSVLDSNCNQEDIFQSVGVSLVKNALEGYNTTLLSYGQSGSGKTYTMWGPPSAMVEDPSPTSHQGIAPRMFKMMLSQLQREEENTDMKQFNYQCRCSFLEIYNDQVVDLLDPTRRNLEIKNDGKNGSYVENLSEEYVTCYEDVTQILIKGLSSRKVGATSLNPKSSRSHIVFTFIIESWCKETLSKSFSSSKTSRITIVDLAGLDRNRVEDATIQRKKESKNVKKSLSQLGHLVEVLARETESRRIEVTASKKSCLTRLLQESLGGNSILSVICSISPYNKNNGETLQTLRFGQRIRSIKNDPVINEIKQDDVNDLSDQIRQLKEELIRAKYDVVNSQESRNGFFQGTNVRESLNQLRASLNRSLFLPNLENDTDDEINVDVEDVKELYQQINNLRSSCEVDTKDISLDEDCSQFYSVRESCETDISLDDEIETGEECLEEKLNGVPHYASEDNLVQVPDMAVFRNSLSISPQSKSPIMEEPPLSESPRIGRSKRKSMALSSFLSGSHNCMAESCKSNKDVLRQSTKVPPGPAESLAASLQRGLQIIDYHQRNSATNRSSASFSFKHLTLTECPQVDKGADQVIQEKSLLCSSCKKIISEDNSTEVHDSLKNWILGVDEAGDQNLIDKIPKNLEYVLTKAMKRDKELQLVCKEQAKKIEELNQMLVIFKAAKDQNLVLDNSQVNKRASSNKMESLELHALEEAIEENCEIKEVQVETQNKSFNSDEKEALLEEIHHLRSKLQLYNDTSLKKSTEKLRSSVAAISRSIQLRRGAVFSQGVDDQELEKERQRWTEIESDWISLTDELRIDLEAIRHHAEKVEMELKSEKKCTEELDDALKRSVIGHARMIEHYAELQDKYNDLAGRYRAIMEGIEEVKKAAAKAGKKGRGSRFAKSLATELSALRVERERERDLLKKENKNLKLQLRDTAEAVHAAGELLVRLREAEQAASIAEENHKNVQEKNDKLIKQMEKLKRKHKMEMITMKQYIAESRLPESALRPLYREDSDVTQKSTCLDDDQDWRTEFGAIYQEHY